LQACSALRLGLRKASGRRPAPDCAVSGALYLVPNLLGTVAPGAVLPARTIAVARGIAHWIVETPKAARAFLSTLEMPVPIAQLSMTALAETASDAELEALLAPARDGHAVGLLSDAGAPAVADPGARVVAVAHRMGIRVVPLVGPSSILLALMASGMNGQQFAFHGYLPQRPDARAAALGRLEAESRTHARAQAFIETPYRNIAMLESIARTLAPTTRVCVAVDLTLTSESVITLPVSVWRGRDFAGYAKRPAMFVLQA
jgi:16S rRNA (cytidine1402-2'-O)-methyltransferase